MTESGASWDVRGLGTAVGLCVAMAVLEGVLSANGLPDWYAGLAKPWWHVPIWAFAAVAIAVYVLEGFVAYRLCTQPLPAAGRAVGLTALSVVMLFNALWNYVLLQSRDLFAVWVLLIAFLAPLVILQVALTVYERRSAVAFSAYLAWVLCYDLPLYYTMWCLNPG
ncbi:MAG: TspO/MBR family protein [Planctomycetota bacterium]